MRNAAETLARDWPDVFADARELNITQVAYVDYDNAEYAAQVLRGADGCIAVEAFSPDSACDCGGRTCAMNML